MISREMLRKIVDAVQRARGDLDDVKDLVAVWERLERTQQLRADAMRREAQAVRCFCIDGAQDRDRRCARCFGQMGAE
jgi:hypothetical protein